MEERRRAPRIEAAIEVEVIGPEGKRELSGTLWLDGDVIGDYPPARLRLRWDHGPDDGEWRLLWFEREADGVYRHRVPAAEE
jgi:hypothetical protein